MKSNRLHRLISVVLSASLMLAGLTVAPSLALAVPVDGGTVTSDLNCVTFVSSTTGFAAGAAGVILKTTNAGASWRTVRSGDTYDFRGISFADASNGWAITLYGQVVRTTNAGESWSLVTSDAGGDSYVVERFYDIDLWSSTSGLAAGGAQGTPPLVAKTTNAGSFWSIALDSLLGSYDPPTTQPPFPRDGLGYAYGMDVRSSTKAWVAGQDVFKTPTLSVIWAWSGSSWTQQSVTGTGRLLDIAFGSDTAGIAVGDAGQSRYTLNGGTSWIAATTGITTELSGVGMTSTGSGWAVGQSGRILRTTNYGATWATQTSGTGSYLEDIAVLNSTTAVVVGRGGTILRTDDGSTWRAPAAAPVVSWVESSSHPVGEWKASAAADILWSATGDIDGYGFVFDQSATTTPTALNITGTPPNTSRVGTATASGAWYAHVAAHDTAGRWSAPKHRQVLVDIDKPVATDDVDPAGYSSATTITISATDLHSGVASIRYSINGVPQAPVSGSVARVPFSLVGEYALTYTATDNAGNVSLMGSATVYVRPPAAPVMTGLSSASHPLGQWGNSSAVSLEWSATGTGVSGYGLVFDQVPTTVVSTQTTTATLGVGTATWSGTWYAHVAAVDSYDQWSATRHLQVLVDMTRPIVTDDVDPAGYEGSATINLNATDLHSGVASISYSVSGGATTTVAGASASIVRSTPGTYTVSYIASDAAGNVSVLGSAIVYVRALPPPAAPVVTALTSATHPVGTWVSALGVSLAWSATGTGITGYGLAFDQSPSTSVVAQTTGATSGTGTATGSGAWYAHVAAVDSIAQWSATRHLQVLVDTVRPLAADDVDPAGYVSSATVTLSATDAHSGVVRILYSIDGVPQTPVSGSVASIPLTSTGDHALTYTAEDNAGNQSLQGSTTVHVRMPAPPVMTGLASSSHPAGQWGRDLNVALVWTATGAPTLGYGAILDQSPSTVVSTQTTTLTSAALAATGTGIWYAHVAARDTYGQWSATQHLQVLVDAQKPLVVDDVDSAGYEGAATVTLSATDAHSGVASISYSVNGSATTTVSGYSATLVRSAPGTYTVSYSASDLAGNVSTPGSAVVYVRAPAPPPAVAVAVQGADRYLTAIEACDRTFGSGVMPVGPDGHRTAIIASGENWPDALAAAGLAGAYEAPLLLTRKDALPAAVASRIQSLGVDRVFIVGGTAAVTAVVAIAIDARVPGTSAAITRLSGATRYETSARVAVATLGVPGRPAWDGTAFVATGGNFPDALAAGPLAAAKGIPLYLSNPTGIAASTIAAMKSAGVTKVYVLGGPAAVSEASVSALNLRGIALSDRWAGANRYATAATVAANSLNLGLSPTTPALATGTNYPDALAGGVMQGAAGSVVILTNGTSLSVEAGDFLSAKKADVRELRFLGGPMAISTGVRTAAMAALSSP